MTYLPKPSESEGKITLSPAERAAKRLELCHKQKWRCANCRTIMCKEAGYFNSAQLDHIEPEPMGCAKRDNESNLQVLCAHCNGKKGSRRES